MRTRREVEKRKRWPPGLFAGRPRLSIKGGFSLFLEGGKRDLSGALTCKGYAATLKTCSHKS